MTGKRAGMGRRRYIALVAFFVLLSASGRGAMTGPPGGFLFSWVRGPVAVATNMNSVGYNSHGESMSWSVFYVLTFGDASIRKAKEHGSAHPESVNVTHVDYQWIHFLGCGQYTLRVYFYDPAIVE